MPDSLAGLVLAAGAGTRMLPLTRIRPKPLLPLGESTLVDHAVDRVRSITGEVVVNVHAARSEMERHLGDTVVWSVEDSPGLGTAGGVASAARVVPGYDLVVVNGDTWCPGDLVPVFDGWDRERTRVVVAGPPVLEPTSRIVVSFVPAAVAGGLALEPSGLFEVCWSPAASSGRLDVVGWDGPIIDCATPRDHLLANLALSGGTSVIGAGAVVEGTVTRSVVWPGARVWPGEDLVNAIRTDAAITVLVRDRSAPN